MSARRTVDIGRVALETLRYLTMVVATLVFLVPLVWLFVSSIRPAGTIFQFVTQLSWRTFIPETVTLENYRALLMDSDFPRALFNTVFVGVATVVAGVLINAAAGFAFATFSFRGKRVLFAIVLATFMMPFESIVLPLYVLIRDLGWVNSYQALILPAVANGLVIFLFRQFMAAIPFEIYDAARIDGGSWFQIFVRIATPLSWPTIATASLMLFVSQWEAFFWPLIAASAPEYTVVQVAITRNITFEKTAWGNLFASTSVAVLVPLILYVFLQRYYIRSIVESGIK